jgi:hypothetical protein
LEKEIGVYVVSKAKLEMFKKSELFKLVLASNDIDYAEIGLIVFENSMKRWSENNGNTLVEDSEYVLDVLESALIIHYSKPFIGNKPFGTIGTKWKIFKKNDFLKVHKSIIDLRHTSEAHSDMNQRDIYMYTNESGNNIPKLTIAGWPFLWLHIWMNLKLLLKNLNWRSMKKSLC